jgi:biofilm PGA synthesis N-glycosyltransferase PgaC
MAPPYPEKKDRSRYYWPVKLKLAFGLSLAIAWVVLCTWLAIPWIHALSALTGLAAAIVIVAGIALIPGFANAFVVAGLLLDRRPRFEPPKELPPVTILIAAFNETRHIGHTLRAVYSQTYAAPVEIIVIDDGSTDNTAELAREVAEAPERPANMSVDVISRAKNAGKSAALNLGLDYASHALIVTMDADTYPYRDALRNLVTNHISSPPNTRATAGTVLARNSRQNTLTRLQEWDYFQGISVVKRIQSLYQGTMVAQGAFSVYDYAALREVGGWPETVGEDIVLTWALNRQGYRVGYAENAFVFTNVPETLGRYFRQRRRWARGLMEAFRHHPSVLIKPRLNLPFVYLNLLYPYLDLMYLLVFIPGLVGALFFEFYAVVGLMTLFLITLALVTSSVMYLKQRKVFHDNGLRIRRNIGGMIAYMAGYQLVLAPASLLGYFSELFNVRKRW